MSKSCEDLTRNQSSLKDEDDSHVNGSSSNGGRAKSRKFTFQSTIRQIERRRIAEKLSKEAEEKG